MAAKVEKEMEATGAEAEAKEEDAVNPETE